MDNDGNPTYEMQQIKTPYVSGTEITSAVYFEANAVFGESGGEIRYSLDNGATWNVYDGILLTVKRPAQVKFRAVSNTYTHPDNDVYPYPDRYPLTDNWGDQTVEVVIQLEQVVVTLDDLVIEGATKTFDGTDVFNGSVSVREGFYQRAQHKRRSADHVSKICRRILTADLFVLMFRRRQTSGGCHPSH